MARSSSGQLATHQIARLPAHTVWGLPFGRKSTDGTSVHTDQISDRHSHSSRASSQELDEHVAVLEKSIRSSAIGGASDDPQDCSPAADVERRTSSKTSRGRAGQSLAASSNIDLTTELKKYGLRPDEVHIMSDSCLSDSDSEQGEIELEDYPAFILSCSIEPPQHCVGRYEVATRSANRRLVWQRDGGDYWLYGGIDGKWYVADQGACDCDFYCAYGFIRSIAAHDDCMPTEATQWEWWDGDDWNPDVTIRIHASSASSASSVPVSADDHVLALPSKGSQGHLQGDCKPCRWYWTRGCQNGANCIFCHMCPQGEMQKRRNARKKRIKMSKGAKKARLRLEAAAAKGDRSIRMRF